MSPHARWIAIALLARLPCAAAQEVDATWYGDQAGDYFGQRVRFVGDVDGDGWTDIAGASIDYGNPSYVCIFSGQSYAVIRTVYENVLGDGFGSGLGAMGDLDGDGFDDLLVTAPGDDTSGKDSGSASVYSGRDGSVLLRVDGTTADPLGFNACELGDVDGDGFADFAVSGSEKIFIHSSKSGARLFTLKATIPGGSSFGLSVADAGDIDGDGTDDIIVGEPSCYYTSHENGRAYVFSGKTGGVIYNIDSGYSSSGSACFGYSVAGAGDVDRDGRDDFVIGWPYFVANYHGTVGGAVVYSGRTGTILFGVQGVNFWKNYFDTSFAGWSVAPAGDINGDGYPDIAVGDSSGHFWNGGEIDIFSGLNGALLIHVERDKNEGTGTGASIDGGIDLDRDGRLNVLSSSPYAQSPGGAYQVGRVDLLDFGTFFVDAIPRHPFTRDTLLLQAAQIAPAQPGGIFLVGVNGAPTFSLLHFGLFDSRGTLWTYGTVPSGFSGASVTIRAYALDPSNHLLVSNDTTIEFQ